jgi:GTP-binding protein HflX
MGDGDAPGRSIAGAVLVSALTGFGLDVLRAELAALLASLWVEVDLSVPYAAGDVLARIRERGTVEIEYREHDVRVRGRVSPPIAHQLAAAGRGGR